MPKKIKSKISKKIPKKESKAEVKKDGEKKKEETGLEEQLETAEEEIDNVGFQSFLQPVKRAPVVLEKVARAGDFDLEQQIAGSGFRSKKTEEKADYSEARPDYSTTQERRENNNTNYAMIQEGYIQKTTGGEINLSPGETPGKTRRENHRFQKEKMLEPEEKKYLSKGDYKID